jgi:hypothetical protein
MKDWYCRENNYEGLRISPRLKNISFAKIFFKNTSISLKCIPFKVAKE